MFKGAKNRNSGYVDRQQVRSIDQNLLFPKLKLETVMTTVNEVNSDETKVPDKFIFSVLIVCFTAESSE